MRPFLFIRLLSRTCDLFFSLGDLSLFIFVFVYYFRRVTTIGHRPVGKRKAGVTSALLRFRCFVLFRRPSLSIIIVVVVVGTIFPQLFLLRTTTIANGGNNHVQYPFIARSCGWTEHRRQSKVEHSARTRFACMQLWLAFLNALTGGAGNRREARKKRTGRSQEW